MSLPEGWRQARLGEECSIEIGGTPSRSMPEYWDEERETGNLWVSIRDMNHRIVTQTAEQITASGIAHSNVKLQAANTVLLSFKLTIGRVAFAGKPLYTNEAIAGLRSDTIDHDYLFYGLQQWDLLQGVDQAIKGATLNKQKLRRIEFTLPKSKFEQAKIAEILSSLNRVIEQTEALVAKQERINNGLLHDLLSRGVDENGDVRSPDTHSFKPSSLGSIPDDWDVKTCKQLCKEIVVGIVIRPVQYYRPEGIPMLRSANIKENRIGADNLVFMSAKDNERLQKSQIFEGDLVTVRTGYPGTTSAVPAEFHGCNCIDLVICRPDPMKVRSEFLSIWINSDNGKKQVLEGQGGLAQQHFNVGEMKSLLVRVPKPPEQERIERILVEQRSTRDATARSLQKLRALRTALMTDLLTGHTRVTPMLEALGQPTE